MLVVAVPKFRVLESIQIVIKIFVNIRNNLNIGREKLRTVVTSGLNFKHVNGRNYSYVRLMGFQDAL